MGLINTENKEYIKVVHSDEYAEKDLYNFWIEKYVNKEHRDSGDLMEFPPAREQASEEIRKEYTNRMNKFKLIDGKSFREAKIIAAYTSIKTVEGSKWEDSIQ